MFSQAMAALTEGDATDKKSANDGAEDVEVTDADFTDLCNTILSQNTSKTSIDTAAKRSNAKKPKI